MTVLKPSQLKARTGAILDKAKHTPIYVERDGTLLVITKAKLVPAQDDPLLSPWELTPEDAARIYAPDSKEDARELAFATAAINAIRKPRKK